MSLYEFTWAGSERNSTFRTSCPKMGEVFMRSGMSVLRVNEEIQADFDAIYGLQRGKFEELLRAMPLNQYSNTIKSNIPGLTIEVRPW